jgi:hypothetical protein
MRNITKDQLKAILETVKSREDRFINSKDYSSAEDAPHLAFEGAVYKLDPKAFLNTVGKFVKALEKGSVADFKAALRPEDDTLWTVVSSYRSPTSVIPSFEGLPPNPRDHNWPFPQMLPGLYGIVGGTGSGKTDHVRELQPDLIIRFSEPLESVDIQTEVPIISCRDFFDVVLATLVCTASGLNVAVDSLRGLLYSLRGPATGKGIVGTVFTLFTTLNNFCAFYDAVVPVVINPMVDDKDIEHVYNRMAASMTAASWIQNSNLEKLQYRGLQHRVFFDKTTLERVQKGVSPSDLVDVSGAHFKDNVSLPSDEDESKHHLRLDMDDLKAAGRGPLRPAVDRNLPDADDVDDFSPRVTPPINL